MEISKVQANNLTFDCNITGPTDGTPVMLLHGWPNFGRWWIPLTSYWLSSNTGIRAVACDLRGYSPGAAPENPSAYTYDVLATDVYALADAVGFKKFHLAGHDHGCGLGWFVAAENHGGRILSYAGLSVPHDDAMSAAFMDTPDRDEPQIVASNYFNQFALPDSATRNNNSLSKLFGLAGFPSPAAFQKSLFWYNGSVGMRWARPPVVSDAVVAKYTEPFVTSVRKAIPLPTDQGSPAKEKVGNLTGIPTLFVCGQKDPYLLCTRPYALKTADYVQGAAYHYFKADCGHDLLSVGGSGGCTSESVLKLVLDRITTFIAGGTPSLVV
eukprot:TRINITY_DN79130_c0_g1_i1.p1 TRINITY_DN79130_c0_g1~~TRINITY_DN79130_c0_g1_i1.p1  ORF type:complete len:367 (+),score=41.35 TRINITY_DN79130_c0_g1_i1:124-1101(+)